MYRSIAAALILCALTPRPGSAHGVRHAVTEGATVIHATYDNGSPMAFCDATVVSPADPDTPYQTGTTDPHGYFAFVPDTNGLWKVTVDDDMGHVVMAEVMQAADGLVSDAQPENSGLSRPLRFVLGLSLIFGLFGIYSLAREATRRTHPEAGCGKDDCACTSPKV